MDRIIRTVKHKNARRKLNLLDKKTIKEWEEDKNEN